MIILRDHDNVITGFRVGGHSIISSQTGLFGFVFFVLDGEEQRIIDSHTVPGVSWIQDKHRHMVPGKSVIG